MSVHMPNDLLLLSRGMESKFSIILHLCIEYLMNIEIDMPTMQYVTDADLIDVSSLYPSPMRLVGTWNA